MCQNMNTLTIIKLLCAFIIFDCVCCQRISKLKCDELASLSTDTDRYSHLLVLRHNENSDMLFAVVMLISEDYVLTSALIVTRIRIKGEDNFELRKYPLSDQQYPDNEYFTIKRLIQHPLYKIPVSTDNIGLIQLNEGVLYHNSIFRPACLWTETNKTVQELGNIYAYTSYEVINSRRKDKINQPINTATIITLVDCTKFRLIKNVGPKICLYVNGSDAYSFIGELFDVQVGGQSYIFAVAADLYFISGTMLFKSIKVSNYIPWIESIVWPNHTDQGTAFHNENSECGQRKIKHKPLMAYALPTYHGEFPWHVALYRNLQYGCGGTILNSRTIVTAAHCVHDERGIVPPNRIIIAAGTYNLNENPIEAENYVVVAITVHENYTRTYLENDIALLKIRGSIEFSDYIQPICMANNLDYSKVTIGLVAGWGRNEYNQSSSILLQATLPIIDEFECRRSNRNFFPTFLNSRNYCAGYRNGTNVCSGDSGGGMIFWHESGWFIRGIVSLGVALPNSNQCDVTQLVLFTDITKFFDWIENEKFTEDN